MVCVYGHTDYIILSLSLISSEGNLIRSIYSKFLFQLILANIDTACVNDFIFLLIALFQILVKI